MQSSMPHERPMSCEDSRAYREWTWLWNRIRPHREWHLAGVAFIAVGSLLALVDPWVMKWMIDTVLPNRRLLPFASAVGIIFLSYTGRWILCGIGDRLTFHANQCFIRGLRAEVLAKITVLSADYHDGTSTGSKLYCVRDSIDELGSLSSSILPFCFRTILTSACILVAMFVLNARLACVVLPLIPLFLYAIWFFRKRLRVATESVQNEDCCAASFLEEYLGTITQIQLLNREMRKLREAWRVWARLVRAEYRRSNAELVYALVTTVIVVIGITAVLAYGGMQVIRGTLTIGALVAFYAYLIRIFEPLYTVVEVNSRLQRMAAFVSRLMDLLDRIPSIEESRTTIPLPLTGNTGVCFREVSFSYSAGKPALKDFNLCIAPEEKIGLVGESGCGKSTTAKLMVRLYDVDCGSIVVDGVDVRDLTFKSLRSRVCYLPQHAVLFNCSMEENIRLGNPSATKQEVSRAIELAGLDHVTRLTASSLHESLGPRGELLSGGERQRVAIARAILQKPRVLILDESTSELDGPTERTVLERVNHFLSGSTIVIISHRLTALTWLDRIVVMDQGAVVAHGAHSTLYGENDRYTELYRGLIAGAIQQYAEPRKAHF
jgi:ABC-type multidrug transport system fused ATPase/permease subunit